MNGVELERVESTLEGRFDLRGYLGIAPVGSAYDEVHVRLHVTSRAPAETIRQLVERVRDRSPVFSTVPRPVSVAVVVELD